jgi:crotonobetainyl-CoA:carnitine CoA-transferase CaiB-like acyl-CoA transferase
MAFRPLAGIRVLDLTSSLAGPTATEILGAFGADVVKIEHPGRGDEARDWGPRFFEGGSVMFFSANAGKRSLALDLKSPEGLEPLLRVAKGAEMAV